MTGPTTSTALNAGADSAVPPQIRQPELLGHSFFDITSDAVVIINRDGAIVHLNTQTEKLFGYRRNELLDQPVELLLPEPLRAQHAEYRRRYFQNPLPRPMGSNFVAVGLRKDGSEIPIDIALSPLQTESGLHVASAIRDMSRQRQLEDKLRQRTRDLEEADRHKDDFLATFAHELRSPLAAVTYSAELLRRPDIAAGDREKAAGIVIDETAFIRRLVNDLCDISRIGRGELPIRKVPTDLGAAARFAVETSRPLIEQLKHVLEVVMPPVPIRVDGDAVRLTQLISNLLNNAARYTPDGGHIRLSVEQMDGTAVIKVKDNGIGIPKNMLTGVFDLFTRLDAARSRYADGLGIGLAYARRLAEAQGGSVQAFSDGEGQGSEFVVHLLLTRHMETAAPAITPAAALSVQPSTGICVPPL